MIEKSIYLFCTEGSADKEYHAHLRKKGDLWMVQYANGPRGKVGQSKDKTAAPISFESAEKVFNDLVKSKKKTGYTEEESGVRFTNTEDGLNFSDHRQQLPTSISEEDVDQYISSSSWCAQEKANGERRSIQVKDGVVRGINKLGIYVNTPEPWACELGPLDHNMFDGEQVGEKLYVFDMLIEDGKDIKNLSFQQRYQKLERFLSSNSLPSVELLKASFTLAEKMALLEYIKSTNREGLVFKNIHMPYEAGRSDNALKFKLVESVTCIVLAHNDKRSVKIGLLDADGKIVPVGNVTVPSFPPVEALIEVEYLYFNPGGAFEQPVFLGLRNDVLREEAVISQIKRLKPDVEMDDSGKRVQRERC